MKPSTFSVNLNSSEAVVKKLPHTEDRESGKDSAAAGLNNPNITSVVKKRPPDRCHRSKMPSSAYGGLKTKADRLLPPSGSCIAARVPAYALAGGTLSLPQNPFYVIEGTLLDAIVEVFSRDMISRLPVTWSTMDADAVP